MKIEQEILINKYGQGIITPEPLVNSFMDMNTSEKDSFMNDFLFLIMQSKPLNEDAENAIIRSGLKPTFTPCTMLKKGVDNNNLKKIVQLPENEKLKAFKLLLELYKIAYQRRFEIEKNHPNKWWYWDLANPEIENKIYSMYN